jgi:PTH1 family peptidyl-tRNA hydrolase
MAINYTVVGLGNPGDEYVETRHNMGRMVLDAFVKKNECADWKEDKKLKSFVSNGKVGKNKAVLIKPETFMNKSGEAVKPIIKTKKAAETLLVIHDDLDLPLGKIKISFNKSSGGHRGVESVIKAVKTEGFIRLRMGISGETASGKIKKPQGEEKVIDTILGDFKESEKLELKKTIKKAVVALEMTIEMGWSKAASLLGTLK